MNGDRWLLPEGIEELLPPQAAELDQLRRKLLDLFRCWGYELVMPPLVEYLDSLLTGTGNDLDIQTFKLTDQASGRLLGVRADMTPQVARIDAHRLADRAGPVRLCYHGTVLNTRGDGLGGSRSFTQIGAELYGHAGVESDSEMLCLMLETLHTVDVDEVFIDLGHVGIFRALSVAAGLTKRQESQLFDALQRKAVPEIGALLDEWDLASDIGTGLAALPWLNGGVEVLARARQCLGDDVTIVAALDQLEGLAEFVGRQRPGIPLHFDLAELRGYHYHTGVVFAAYVPGSGRAIAQGGRYDDIGRVFGRSRPATGFSADLNGLMGLAGVAPAASGGIFAPACEDAALQTTLAEKVVALRASGERVVAGLPGQLGGAAEAGCERILIAVGGRWLIQDLKVKGK
ncbi:MAG: ATP phosphoribosyltransferase regulatory subunit [Gammaproteobacteria bacterium]|nr:ATP phosphoribosyltransferase regulatory subunit [Gammaproteobacteria bacterium]MCF6363193.1 ATP phosphoribosyltransferase regulatory subunit [Gammaproteobacteria bacterium]